ncbi:MAG: ATP-binding cassette, subfamily bacterial PglK [Desulfovibrionales bacterium]|nr:ATP-binding cassette, subfamily bacterial PglK [Desulfovibrionales bacterium]
MSSNLASLSVTALFGKILSNLPKSWRKTFYILFAAMAVVALFETASLGSIAFYVSVIANPETALHSSYTQMASQFLPPAVFADTKSFIISLSIFVVLLIAFKNLLQVFVNYRIAKFSSKVESYYGGVLLNGFLNMPYEWHLNKNSADMVLAVQWRIHMGRGAVLPGMLFLCDLLLVLCMLSALIIASPLVSGIVLVFVGGTACLLSRQVRPYQARVAGRCRDYEQYLNLKTTTAIHAFKDLIILNRTKFFLQAFMDKAVPLARDQGMVQVISKLPLGVLETFGFFMLAGSICLISFYLDFSTARVTGTVSLLAVTAWRVLPAVNRILNYIIAFRNARPMIESELRYVDEMRPAVQAAENPPSAPEGFCFNNSIEFQQVRFTFASSETEVLRGVQLAIQCGQTVGVIGPSGAGKSTFADILIGLLQPTGGEVAIDGLPLQGGVRRQWLSDVGYVPQTPYILDGSIAENIALGVAKDEIDRERVLECARMAAMDYIADMPLGVDSMIGERGVMLSGGQRQRVAIARALYRQPKILVFDEATSSLDGKSEDAIMQTIYSFKNTATMVIIAHRLTTVENCDMIAWLEDGVIQQFGPPEEVLPRYQAAMHQK